MTNGVRPTAGPNELRGRVLLGKMLSEGIEPTPQLLEGLLYAGRIHSIAGPAGVGKTILAVWMCLQVMLEGLPVLYLDAENGPKIIAERLDDMGAGHRMLDELFHYYPADLTLDLDSLAALQATVVVVQPALVVFDSLADFLGMADVDENSNTDCTRWFAEVIQPLKNENVASLVLDHMPKTGKGGPRGASSKVAKMDVQWELKVPRTFSREQTGTIKLERTKDRESWLPRTVRFSIGGGEFPQLAQAIEEPDDPPERMTNNARKLYNTMWNAGKEGARWIDLERAVGGSKGNVTRGLKELAKYDFMDRRNGRYVVKGTVPEQPNPIPDSRSTAQYHNGTSVANGTSGSGSVPPGTTPHRGGTSGTTDAGTNGTSLGRRPTTILLGPPEDTEEPSRSSPHHTDAGWTSSRSPSPPSQPSLIDVADSANTAITTTENEAYLPEDRQQRQHHATSDESVTSSTPPNNSANGGGHGRRLTMEDVELVKRLIDEGESAADARAKVLRLEEPK